MVVRALVAARFQDHAPDRQVPGVRRLGEIIAGRRVDAVRPARLEIVPHRTVDDRAEGADRGDVVAGDVEGLAAGDGRSAGPVPHQGRMASDVPGERLVEGGDIGEARRLGQLAAGDQPIVIEDAGRLARPAHRRQHQAERRPRPNVARIGPDCFFQRRRRRRQRAAPLMRQRQVVVGVGEIGRERERPLAGLHRRLEPVEFGERPAEVRPNLRLRRVALKALLVAFRRRRQRALLGQRVGQRVGGGHVVGPIAVGASEGRDRARQVAGQAQRGAEADQRVGRIRPSADHLAIGLDRGVEVAPLGRQLRQVEPSVDVIGLRRQQLPVGFGRFDRSIQRRQAVGPVEHRRRVGWRQRERPLERRQRLGRPPGRLQRVAEVGLGRGVVRVARHRTGERSRRLARRAPAQQHDAQHVEHARVFRGGLEQPSAGRLRRLQASRLDRRRRLGEQLVWRAHGRSKRRV